MGCWNITVVGTGAHNNMKKAPASEDNPYVKMGVLKAGQEALVPDGNGGYEHSNPGDADLLFQEFVDKLRAHGHHIEHASFTQGGRETR